MPGGIHPPLSVIQEWARIGNPLHPSETRGWGLAVLCIILYTLTVVIFLARLWVRLKARQTAGVDDIVIALAMIPTTGLAIATAIGSSKYGFNRHVYDLTPEMAVQSRQITMAVEASYVASTGLTKISILLFYRRMSDGTISKLFKWLVRGSIAFVATYMVTFLSTLFLGCIPISAFWNQVNIKFALTHAEGVDYHCIDEPVNLMVASAISIIQDFLACGLPMLLFCKLHLPRRQKIALAAVFGVGFFLCITGMLRVYYIHYIFYETYDATWTAWDAWVWTTFEAHLAIICASAPALKFFFTRYLNVRSLTDSFGQTFRQRTMSNKGLSKQNDYAYGKTLAGVMDGTNDDIELGGINVTKSFDVESHSLRSGDEKISETSIINDERPIRAPSRQATRKR